MHKAVLTLPSLVLLVCVAPNLLFILIIDNDDPLPTQKPTNGVSGGYLLGAGRADCTGPVAEIPLVCMGN